MAAREIVLSGAPAWVRAYKFKILRTYRFGCRHCRADWGNLPTLDVQWLQQEFALFQHDPDCLIPLAQACESTVQQHKANG